MSAGEQGASPILGNGVGRRSVAFRFFPQGNSATPYTVANGQLVDPDGWIFSCARTSQGFFTIRLTCNVAQVLSIVATPQSITADSTVHLFDITNLAPLNFRIAHELIGVAQDMAANANNSIMVLMELELATRNPT